MLILPCGVAVVEGDTHVSAWVAKQKKLAIAESYLAPFRKYVPFGGTIVDVGAMIGDHTVTYAEWVGPMGVVHAFEPNPAAFECLRFNTQNLAQVMIYNLALANFEGSCTLHPSPNAGASYVSKEWGEVGALMLDSMGGGFDSLDFLKIDAEGFETFILEGAQEIVSRCRPVMLLEVNEGALVRAGSSRDKLLGFVNSLGYSIKITAPKLKFTDLQYDVLCVPEPSV